MFVLQVRTCLVALFVHLYLLKILSLQCKKNILQGPLKLHLKIKDRFVPLLNKKKLCTFNLLHPFTNHEDHENIVHHQACKK